MPANHCTLLKAAILACLNGKPKTYAEIEAAVGPQKGFMLGIVLTRMALDKEIVRGQTRGFYTEHPVYSDRKLPPRFRFPRRVTVRGAVEVADA